MRSQNNIKKFGHVTKSMDERRSYQETIEGQGVRSTTDDFNFAGEIENTTEIEGEVIQGEILDKKQGKSYSSAKTQFLENWVNYLVSLFIAIVVGVGGWLLYSVNEDSKTNAVQDNRIEEVEGDVVGLKKNLRETTDRSIKSEVLLEQIDKQFNNLPNFSN